jgi:hypothetical protein
MQGMLPAASAEFLHFQTLRIIAPILHGRVVPLLALGTGKVDDHPNVFFLRHDTPVPF